MNQNRVWKKTIIVIFLLIMISGGFLCARRMNLPSVEAGYYGETVTHPGITVSLGYKIPINDNYVLTPLAKIGWYVHPQNHHGLFIEAGIRQQTYIVDGFIVEVETLAGLLNTLQVSEDESNSWEQIFMGTITGGLAWNLAPMFDLPLEPFLKAGAFWEYSNNAQWVPHTLVESGVRF